MRAGILALAGHGAAARFAGAALGALAAGCGTHPRDNVAGRGPWHHEYTRRRMGVMARIVIQDADERRAARAASTAFDAIGTLESSFSDYIPGSELMRLCRDGWRSPVQVSDDLFAVLARAIDHSRQSQGAFDVSVGPLVALWREARRTGKLPPAQALAEARSRVGWQGITLHPSMQSVSLAREGMRLDLGGIGKGYAVDVARQVLADLGCPSAMVEMGGDLALNEPPPGRMGWAINLAGQESPRTRLLSRCCVSTSGDSAQYVIIDGVRYSHVIDPRTGWAVEESCQVTVIGPRGVDTDALSSTLTILGSDAGAAYARTWPEVEAIILPRPDIVRPS